MIGVVALVADLPPVNDAGSAWRSVPDLSWGMILANLFLVEIAKKRFDPTQGHPTRTIPTGDQRLAKHIRRRPHRFTRRHSPRMRR